MPKNNSEADIIVYGLNTDAPADAVELGTIRSGDTGFTVKCGYFEVLDVLKSEARKAGGNAIKIIEHIPPGHSTCHRFTVKVLVINKTDSKASIHNEFESNGSQYAILNVYSTSDPEGKLNYDIYSGESFLCKVTGGLKKTIIIKKEGVTSIWVKSDVKTEIKVDFILGQTYYLRCSLSKEGGVEYPVIEIVDQKTGSKEFNPLSDIY